MPGCLQFRRQPFLPGEPSANSMTRSARMWSRRHWIGALGAMGSAAALSARAEFRVEITGVGATQLPITLLKFRGEEQGGENLVSAIVRADLERSGAFRMVD